MKLYITKPRHTRYGHMKVDNPYKTIDELINASSVWFMKPDFLKPNICMFEGTVVWNGYENHGYNSSCIKVSSLPDGAIKDHIKKIIRTTVADDFSEIRSHRYYTWMGEVDVTFIEKETSGNFNLYLTKGSPHDITFAGLDRCQVWLEQPKYRRFMIDTGNKIYFNYSMLVKDKEYISGKIFRKTPELEPITAKLWKSVVDSFDIKFEDMNDFYMKINDRNHKIGLSSKKFSKVFFFDLILNKETV